MSVTSQELVDSPAVPEAAPAEQPAGTGEAPAASPARLYVLDLLRFLAAMSVFSFHLLADDKGTWGADLDTLFTHPVHQAALYGWLGVQFFFVISGFVICMSCWGRTLSEFFVSRVSRLVPAYVFAVLLTSAVLALWPYAHNRPDAARVLYHTTMMEQFLNVPWIDTVYWTLFVELKFYLLFSIVVFFGLTYKRVVAFCVLWTTFALYATFINSWFLDVVVEPRYANFFVAGITLYLMHRYKPNLLLWCILVLSVILCVYSLEASVSPFNVHGVIVSFPKSAVLLVAFFAVMVAAALGRLSWLRWRGFAILDALTYPLYLTHAELSRAVLHRFHASVPPVVLLLAFLAGALLLAFAVNRLVERPVASYIRRGLRASFRQIRAADH